MDLLPPNPATPHSPPREPQAVVLVINEKPPVPVFNPQAPPNTAYGSCPSHAEFSNKASELGIPNTLREELSTKSVPDARSEERFALLRFEAHDASETREAGYTLYLEYKHGDRGTEKRNLSSVSCTELANSALTFLALWTEVPVPNKTALFQEEPKRNQSNESKEKTLKQEPPKRLSSASTKASPQTTSSSPALRFDETSLGANVFLGMNEPAWGGEVKGSLLFSKPAFGILSRVEAGLGFRILPSQSGDALFPNRNDAPSGFEAAKVHLLWATLPLQACTPKILLGGFFSLDACLRSELGILYAKASHVPFPETQLRFWSTLGPSLRLEAPLSKEVFVRIPFSPAWNLTHDSFTLQHEPALNIPGFSFQTGLEFGFKVLEKKKEASK